MQFSDLNLIEPLLRAVRAEGYDTPTPIQAQAIPHVLAGRDLLGCAQTGTGKTAAFALPILQRLVQKPAARPAAADPRAWSCRRRASWLARSARAFAPTASTPACARTVIFGGVGQHPQVEALRRGVDILVATPGRLLDLMKQGYVNLERVEIFVLDEADRMLDMGFIHDVRKVIARAAHASGRRCCSRPRCRRRFASWPTRCWRNPVKVQVAPPATTAETHRAVGLLRREARQAPAARAPAARRGHPARARLHAHQARREQRGRAAGARRHRAPRRSTATRARTPASGRSRTSSAASTPRAGRDRHRRARHRRRRRLARRQLRPAERRRRATSTASAAPRAPARRASPSRSATPRSAASCATSRS